MTNESRFNFDETFEVLTGEKPNQKCFTVHRQPFIERSKFLEAATSSRWASSTKKPVDLTDHEPEAFASYMQCVYHGSVVVPELPKHAGRFCLEGLVTLYLLADKLNDFITTNLVTDEIIRMSEELREIPNMACVTLAFNSTVVGSPLRRLCRDYYAHEAAVGVLESIEEGMLPFNFVKFVLLEMERLARSKVGCMRLKCVNREECHYHQHDDEHPKCS